MNVPNGHSPSEWIHFGFGFLSDFKGGRGQESDEWGRHRNKLWVGL